jgi:uncharacterized cupredoxin-like copper-binding protein
MSFRVRHLPLLAGTAALATLVAACGGSGPSAATANGEDESTPAGTRTVEVAMEDIKFDQTSLTVRTGETIEFRFVNDGKVAHDAFIGDVEAQMEHDAEMAEMGDASGHPIEEAAVVVQPGDSGELSYTFSEPGTYQVGCHQPGHYAAGMKIDVTVE